METDLKMLSDEADIHRFDSVLAELNRQLEKPDLCQYFEQKMKDYAALGGV